MIPLRILVLGAGAVGGYLGSKLAASGCDVVFLARGNRLKQLNDLGLVIHSPLGDSARPVAAAESPDPRFVPHLVILACKAPALQSAIMAVKPYVGPDTRILPILNGISHLETLRLQFPENEMLAGIVHGALTLQPDGVIQHLSPFFTTIVGSATGRPDPFAARLIDCLRSVQVDARLSPEIHQELWNKFTFLATLAGVTCLMRSSVGTIMAVDDGRRLTEQLYQECLSVAASEGFPPAPAVMDSYRSLLTAQGSSLTSSMLRDIERGQPTEGRHILGDMLRRAKLHGIDAPILAVCKAHLDCYDYALQNASLQSGEIR
jgi:2-dehydropantoate 2-reductase